MIGWSKTNIRFACIIGCAMAVSGLGVPAKAEDEKHIAAPPVQDPQPPPMSELEFGRLIVMQRCGNCHTTDTETKSFAAPLHGLFGRASASLDGYIYSPVMKNLNVVWTPDTLSQWLTATTFDTPDIRMRHVGVPKENERNAIIAFLKTLPGNDK